MNLKSLESLPINQTATNFKLYNHYFIEENAMSLRIESVSTMTPSAAARIFGESEYCVPLTIIIRLYIG